MDHLVAHQQYGRALDILSRADPTADDYPEQAAKRRHIEALAASYEQTVRRQAREQVEQGQWRAALDLYDDALGRLPQSMVLRDGLAQLHQQQTQELERLELKRLLAHGNWLKQTLPDYRQITQVNPRSRASMQQLSRIQQQAEEVADKLAVIGNRALANNELEIASQTLFLARELSQTPAILDSTEKLQQQLDARQRQAQQQRAERQQRAQAAERARQQRISVQHNLYLAAMDGQDYPAARAALGELQRLDPNNARWRQEQDQLDSAVQQRSAELFSRGINAYGRAHYEEAVIAWEEVLQLEPEHKLAQDNLERARRVLQRVEELQLQQGGR